MFNFIISEIVKNPTIWSILILSYIIYKIGHIFKEAIHSQKTAIEKANENQNKMVERMFEVITATFDTKLDAIIFELKDIKLASYRIKLNKSEARQLFRWCLTEHINKKLEYLQEILEANDIITRREQIEKNLRNKIEEITTNEAEKLSQFVTEFGDMGKILLCVNFDKLMNEISKIFFNEDTIENKLKDIKALMNHYVCDMLSRMV